MAVPFGAAGTSSAGAVEAEANPGDCVTVGNGAGSHTVGAAVVSFGSDDFFIFCVLHKFNKDVGEKNRLPWVTMSYHR